MPSKIVKLSLLHALGTVLYITLLVSCIWYGERFLNTIPDLLGPILMLTVFVLSAAITGSLVLGRPIMWYLNGKKREAITLFIYTLGWLALFVVLLLVFLVTHL